MTVCRRFLVSGRVQGVAYRAWTHGQAKRLQLTGWVKNLADGCVEVVACGEPEAIEMLRAKLCEGPPAARVTAVEEQLAEASGACGFAIR
jgi:acylphosphatase